MNRMYNFINYIYWKKEATKIHLTQDEMKDKLREVSETRKKIDGKVKTRRDLFTNDTYKLDSKGNYLSLYLLENDKYMIYTTNAADDDKNDDNIESPEEIFADKFKEINGLTLRKAFGYVDKTIKRCIPRSIYYVNEKYVNTKRPLIASSIDMSSQYPSGCYGLLPDAHEFIKVEGVAKPTAEYPFAFYSSGHLAIYNELDTHDWLDDYFYRYLFRFDENDPYGLKDEGITILCKASKYTMDSTWDYFYEKKKSCAKGSSEYKSAKLVMNQTIGCWHRGDKDTKSKNRDYDNGSSYKLAHIVAVTVARGNKRILDMCKRIGYLRVIHICVDGIIYMGADKQASDDPKAIKIGEFEQEFAGANFKMMQINCYAAEKDGKIVKFKHAGFDSIYGHKIEEDELHGIDELGKLERTETIEEIMKKGEQHGKTL